MTEPTIEQLIQQIATHQGEIRHLKFTLGSYAAENAAQASEIQKLQMDLAQCKQQNPGDQDPPVNDQDQPDADPVVNDQDNGDPEPARNNGR